MIRHPEVIIDFSAALGAGGFGTVYQGRWQGHLVAVKVLERGVPPKMLQKEVDIWKALRHPNILEFYGVCTTASLPFLVSALKREGHALDYIENHPDANRLKILYEALLGLSYLHAHSVIHGDLKAMNILIDEHGAACLSDFGLSHVRKHSISTAGPTSSRTPQGTLRWMAPEQMSRGITNKMSDVYSFGMTMYELLAEEVPFAHLRDQVLYGVIIYQQERPSRPEGLQRILGDLDDDMWSLIVETWSQNP
ncbi:hypothetical protein JAAARDRAFT_184749, partial [Jaapia argillacea MUCL 33604]